MLPPSAPWVWRSGAGGTASTGSTSPTSDRRARIAIAVWTLLGVAGLLAVSLVVVALIDLFSYRTSDGTVVLNRTGIGPPISAGRWSAGFGRMIPGLARRRFLVVDDGHTDATRALVVSERVQQSCPPGDEVDLVTSPILGHVRSARVLDTDGDGRTPPG